MLRYLILATALVTAVAMRLCNPDNRWCDTDPERHGFT